MLWRCLADMGNAERAQHHHHVGRGDRDEKRETARVFRPENIERTDEQNGKRRPPLRMTKSKIKERRERAKCRRDNVIRDQQERADNGDDLRAMAHTGVHTAAIGVVLADRHVIDAHKRGEQAHGQDEPERTIPRHRKRQADDICLAGPPIAVKNRSRACPSDIARSLRSTRYHLNNSPISFPPSSAEDGIFQQERGGVCEDFPCLSCALTRLAVGLGPLNAPGAACTVRPDPMAKHPPVENLGPPPARFQSGHSADNRTVGE